MTLREKIRMTLCDLWSDALTEGFSRGRDEACMDDDETERLVDVAVDDIMRFLEER